MLRRYRHVRGLVGGAAIITALAAGAATQLHAAPVASAATIHAAAATTNKVLFDDTKAETAGNADWIISTSIPDPTKQNASPTKETDWTGALSAWGVALQKTGDYTLDTLGSGDAITYGDSSNPLDLKNFNTYVLDEPNNQLTAAEKTAIMQFVQNGGGLFLISDHKGSDRDNDGWDSPLVINDLMTNNGVDNNDPFGVSDDDLDISSGTPTAINDSTDPVLNGSFGKVTSSEIDSGTTWTLHPSDNANAKGLLYTSGSSGNTGVFFATSTYGSGRVAFWGDSSPVDDGTGESGNTLYNGWDTDSNSALALNATAWLSGSGTTGTTGGTTTGTTNGGTTTGTTGGGTCAAGQELTNSGFESGATGWTATSGIINTSSKEPARTGSYKAWLDGYGKATTDTVAQTVSIPSGCTSASFAYYQHIDTAETSKTTAYDTLKAQVLNSSGTVLGTLATYSNLDAASGYVQHSFNLNSYIGQTVTLKFTGTEDAQDQTSFVLDDTSLNVS